MPTRERLFASPAPAAPRAPRRTGAMVWLPWVCAPAFALLPIAGCGLAGTMPAAPPAGSAVTIAAPPRAPLLPGPRDPRLVRIAAVMPAGLPRR